MRLDAEFTIDSTLGEVTGHKHLLRTPFDPLTNWGACGTSTEFATPFDFGVAVTPSLCYHATLPDGTVDEGRSEILLAAVDVPPIKDTGLQESFVSDPSVSCELDDDDGDDDGGENGDDDRDEDSDDNGSDG